MSCKQLSLSISFDLGLIRKQPLAESITLKKKDYIDLG